MAELFIVRHAQASFGSENYDALSQLGHEQSKILGSYFKERKIDFDLCVRGDLRRHRETLEHIVGNNRSDVVVDDGWNEFPFEQVVAAYLQANPEDKPAKSAPRSDWYRVLRKAMTSWSQQRINVEQETFDDFNQRVISSAENIVTSDAKKVLVVTSGGAIAMWLRYLFQLPPEQAVNFNLQIKNSSIHHFYFNRQGTQLSGFNLIPHLDTAEHLDKITYS